MDYRFKIYEEETKKESEEFKGVGYYTSLSKQKAIEKAIDWLKSHNTKKYFAMIYSFDWKKGNKNVGIIRL